MIAPIHIALNAVYSLVNALNALNLILSET
jgi:hypothetical protein